MEFWERHARLYWDKLEAIKKIVDGVYMRTHYENCYPEELQRICDLSTLWSELPPPEKGKKNLKS